MTVTTPTVRTTLRRSLFWIIVAAGAIVTAVVLALVGTAGGAGVPLGADEAGPDGARALVRVLEQHGVAVEPTGSLDDTLDALDDDPGATVLAYDPDLLLPGDAWPGLARAHAIVLVDPAAAALEALAPAIAPAGVIDDAGAVDGSCALPAAQRAGRIRAAGHGYRIVDDGAGATGCFGAGDGRYAVVQAPTASGGTVTAVGSPHVLDNDGVALTGDAALAIGLLGADPHLVWYLPTAADLTGGDIDLSDLTPGWLSPVLVLGLLAGVAAALWRGRRLGALLVEPLPVVVRASETMAGRARLYARAGARGRAADALRIGTVGRVASALGLPRTASVDDVIRATAALLDAPEAPLRELLLDARPATDRDLVALSDDLERLERRVAAAVRPGATPGAGRPTEPKL
ncbi:DUF4350 domain-containing protein [Galbitalea sp. SE-J8]|uniref:DUF4350 domain-containing protein n=1 Tax=Galbitalea sp. SE-J8 TaxID=3054952 RepID=UPI00259CEED0|nr:DUF4350 domain-containing protein [Galbitalea sp. SE-J8]MDM4762708.1 DUF4350 domain-containing protein [Galbitalea sp. SE-J8]